jgi:coenzyme F420-reducing hydrogenase beta subunit
MELSRIGTYVPLVRGGGELDDLDPESDAIASRVCPFSDRARNEDAIAADLFADQDVAHDKAIGYYQKIVAGHVAAGSFRELGTSGGMTSWMLARLMDTGEVDAVVHVASNHEERPGALSKYTVSRSKDDLFAGRKSRYHVQNLADVMAEVRAEPGRYAVVGVPCFVKAVRLLCDADDVLRQRIVFAASLFCGHLKSTLYSEYLAWSVGVEATDIVDIDYRHKEPGRPPNRYSVRVSQRNGDDKVAGVEKILLADWGLGTFKVGACDYCDDIVGETADVSFGDAWLAPFISDWRGANVAITRSALATRLINEGADNGDLDVVPWTAEEVAASQVGAIRHRRPGLAVRLGNRRRRGEWAPRKRVEPLDADAMNSAFARRMLNREAIAIASPDAFLEAKERHDLDHFVRTMKPLVRRYEGTVAATTWRRAASKLVALLPRRFETLLRRIAPGGLLRR